MPRPLISIALILAFLGVIAGGACLACFDTRPSPDCCNKPSCPMPGRNAPTHHDCSTPAATDFANVDHLLKVISGDLSPADDIAEVRTSVTSAVHSRLIQAPAQRLFTPDLCLVNSILIV